MRYLIAAAALAPLLAGCVERRDFALSCSEYIGQPLSRLLALQGPPVTRISIAGGRSGYVYTATRQSYTGGLPYYEVNYMTRVDNRRTVTRPVKLTCTGTYVTLARPGEPELIVDVWPAR